MRVLALIGFLALSACHSGWEQDPFSGQSDNIQKAVPQGGNPVKEPPVQDVMRVDVKETHVVREGESLNLTMAYRLLHPEFSFVGLELRNLDNDLPGATYDSQTRELIFEPEEGYVISGLVETRVLRVNLIAKYKGLIQERRKDIVFHVVRGSAEDPVIERVADIQDAYIEGDRKTFQIFVRDVVSPEGPVLVVGNYSPNSKNGAHFIEYDKKGERVSGDPTLWRFDAAVDLSSTDMPDVTTSSELFNVEVQAFTSYGVPAKPKNFYYQVYTRANRPIFFLEDSVQFVKGEKNTYSFLVVDPGKEGEVTASFANGCPAGAICECQQGNFSDDFMSRCKVEWTPETTGKQSLRVEATNTVLSFSTDHSNKQTGADTLNIEVIEGEQQ